MPAKNVNYLVMTDNTLYVTTGNRYTRIHAYNATVSRSPREGKLYAIKCDPALNLAFK